MADQKNPGQSGNRTDTEEQAKKGGNAAQGKSAVLETDSESTRETSRTSRSDEGADDK